MHDQTHQSLLPPSQHYTQKGNPPNIPEMSSAAAPPPPYSPEYNGLFGMDDIGGFRYGIGVSIGVLLLITTITLASYYCTRNQLSPSNHSRTHHGATRVDEFVHVIDIPGLDEDTIRSYPKILFSETKVMKKGSDDSTTSCCSICLADYKGTDLLRQLPDCNHMFHVRCVDTWLRLNPTCPVCRTSPLPTPVATPLAEVIPLASAVAGTRMP